MLSYHKGGMNNQGLQRHTTKICSIFYVYPTATCLGFCWEELIALKIPGYYQGAASKWNKSRHLFHWDLMMEKCPQLASKYDEVPNWLRQRLNIDSVKGRGHGRVPPEVSDVVDSILKDAVQDGFELTMASIEEVLRDAVEAYNQEVTKWRQANEDADLKALDALVETGVLRKALLH